MVSINTMLRYVVEHSPAPRYIVVEAYTAFLGRRHDIEDPRMFFDSPPILKRELLHS